jgi:hypothetical protein
MWVPLVDAALKLGTELARSHNISKARKYVDKVADLKEEIREEESLPHMEKDDVKLQNLYQELEDALGNMNNEILLSLAASK